jgi:hypothetical protein
MLKKNFRRQMLAEMEEQMLQVAFVPCGKVLQQLVETQLHQSNSSMERTR